MDLLPTTAGIRPRLAVEIRAEGVVAARSTDSAATLTAVARRPLPEGAVVPGLRAGNIVQRQLVVAALRQALEAVNDRTKERRPELTVIVPDAAVRVLLLEFDALPGKAAEALPVVRFRLKKLLPFDADTASVSYQVMSSSKNLVRVVAVAIPAEVLEEYESAVREAGFEPGVVLPSTLASLAGVDEGGSAALVVNAVSNGVTTAIVQGGVLLLHRSVDMASEPMLVEPVVSLPPSEPAWSPAEEAEAAQRTRTAEADAILEEVEQEFRDRLRAEGSREIVQAVSVATAYYEDILGAAPQTILSAGTTGADPLGMMLMGTEVAERQTRVEEIVPPEGIAASATGVPPCWLAGVRGALRG